MNVGLPPLSVRAYMSDGTRLEIGRIGHDLLAERLGLAAADLLDVGDQIERDRRTIVEWLRLTGQAVPECVPPGKRLAIVNTAGVIAKGYRRK